MELQKATAMQIRNRGVEALAEALGPVGMVRFLQQFDTGSGDYTRDRRQWLKDFTVRGVVKELKSSAEKRVS